MLGVEDEPILERFKREIGTKKPISRHSGKYAAIEISSEQMCRDLRMLNLSDRKTYGHTIPDGISDDLFKYFIRGYFDGDGSISWKQHYKDSEVGIQISGYYNNLCKIADHLTCHNIISSFLKDKRKYKEGNGAFGSLCLPNNISKYAFVRYIYDDEKAPYLERKRRLAQQYIQHIELNNNAMKTITKIYYDYAVQNVR